MKLLKNSVIIIISVLILLLGTYSKSYAGIADIFNGADLFMNAGNDDPSEIINETNEQEGVYTLYYIALGIGIAATVIAGMVIGIQFVISGAEGQAKVKEKLIPFAIGAVVIFGGLGIWRVVIALAQGALN